jgi:glycosyltransferase involved in cell wall biosynthesis
MFIAIVPAYNEQSTIGAVIRGLFSQVDKIVVVDDGSTDSTADLAAQAGAVVLRHEVNRGQGASLETGHEYARKVGADFVLHFDADGQFLHADIMSALEKLNNSGADILFGSRFLDSRSDIPFLKKKILIQFGRLVNFFFAGVNLTDAHNGFRILNKKALDTIIITQEQMAHATEIPSLAKKYNLKIIEHPVKVVYNEFGQGIKGGIRILIDLIFNRFIK